MDAGLFNTSFLHEPGVSNTSFARFSVIVSLFLAFSGCCPATKERIPEHVNFSELFTLVADKSDNDPTAGLRVAVEPDDHRFMITIENLAETPLTLRPSASAFVDEKGRRRSLRFGTHEKRAPAVIEVAGNSTVRIDAAPADKIRTVRDHCFSDTTWMEPLVPWSLADKSRAEISREIDAIYRERAPIGLILRFSRAGTGSSPEIRRYFRLKERWADPAGSR